MEMEGVAEKEWVISSKASLHPLTKLFLMVCISVLTLTGSVTGLAIYPRLLLSLLPCGLLFIAGNRKTAGLFTILYVVCWSFESFVLGQLTGVLGIIVLMVTGMVTRFIPTLAMGKYILETTLVESLVAGLESLKVPTQLTIPFAVMLRFFPTIMEESAAIKDAMRLREIRLSLIFKKPVQYLEYRLVPLMSSVVKIGDELSAAALTKGLGGEKPRTHYFSAKFYVKDIFAAVYTLFLVGFYIYCRRIG